MEFTAKQIAAFLNGEIEGDPEKKVSSVSKIEEGREGSLSFLANPKYEKYIYETASSIVLVNKSFQPDKKINATLIRVENAYEAFARLLDLYQQSTPKKEGTNSLASIHQTASIGEHVYIGEFTCVSQNASIGNGTKIYPQVYVGENVKIGENSIIYPGVKIYHDCLIGSNCIIHSGVVIGSDGFGFAPQEGSEYKKIPQIGNVIIEDDVELGSNVTIDRATMGSTIIHKGVKLDNLIQVAHNVEIGENTVIAAQAGISGSTKVGKNCLIAGQAGLVGHLNIADGVIIGAQAGIGHDLKTKGEIVVGSPAFEINGWRKSSVLFKKLPELREQVLKLIKDVEELKKKLDASE
jgi:UDP-3-O-[3-hydroxymyristoyl] glucosamine N-acyltransferase